MKPQAVSMSAGTRGEELGAPIGASMQAEEAGMPFGGSKHAEGSGVPISRNGDVELQSDPSVTAQEAIDHQERLRSGAVAQEPLQPLRQMLPSDQRAQAEQDVSRLEGVIPRSTGILEQPAHFKQMDAVVLQQTERSHQIPSREIEGGPNQVSAEMPRMSSSEFAAPTDAAWSHEGGDQQSSSKEMPWPSPERGAAPQGTPATEHLAHPISTGSMLASQPPSSEPSAVAPLERTQPLAPVHAAETHAAQVGRAILFQVADPDLGHINIRVAMTNDIVHAYLSSDRPEVGQFLVNGQDRLQSALQANGLEMGQFRVDIDRQNTGRSFQQGQPQDQPQYQGRTWQSGQTDLGQDYRLSELHEYRGAAYAGMLNVVA